MTTLDEAWRWYLALSRQVKLTKRLAGKYWYVLPWDGELGRDDFLRQVESELVVTEADLVGTAVPDLAVLVLFSVFESTVRVHVLEGMKPEVDRLNHPALRFAARDAQERVAEGSFFRVIEPFKAGHADLIEQVNQVRRYRNWVAHGRRGKPPAIVTPESAYERLTQFLVVLGVVSPREEVSDVSRSEVPDS